MCSQPMDIAPVPHFHAPPPCYHQTQAKQNPNFKLPPKK